MFRTLLFGCLIIVCGGGGCTASASDELKLVRTIPLEHVQGRIDHLSITPDGRRLFIAALGNNSVEVVDTEAGVRVASIGDIKEPQGVFSISDSKQLAVASGGDGTVRLFDQSLKLTATLKDLDDADNVRYDAKTKLLYVGYGSGALAVIDPAKAAKLADIKLSGHPESFQLESRGKRIFVNIPAARQIEVVDREARTVVAKWPVKDADASFPMALDESNRRLFVGCRKPSKLLVLDTDSGNTVASLDCCGDTDDVFYDATAKRLYLTGGEGCISVIEQSDADHYRSLGQVKTAAGARTSLFSAAARTLYVAVPHRGNQRAEIREYQPGKP